MNRNIVLLLLIILSAFPSEALWKNHVKPTIKDGFDTKGFIIIGSGIALTALAQTQDYYVREKFSDYKIINNSASRVGDKLGTGIPGAAIALTQLIFDTDNGWAHSEALIDTFIVTSLLKAANKRQRPESDNRTSMPSGHTSTTFASATSLSYAYGWKAALPAYTAAAFTAATRWSDDAHWFSDTVAGAFIGVFFGRATWFHHGTVAPFFDSQRGDYGLILTKRF